MNVIEKDFIFYCDCGFSWQRGFSGNHDCGVGLRARLQALAAENAQMLRLQTDAIKFPKPGDYCIHKSKWQTRPCRVVAHDADTVVIKHLGGGYHGVPAESLTEISESDARSLAKRAHLARRLGGAA